MMQLSLSSFCAQPWQGKSEWMQSVFTFGDLACACNGEWLCTKRLRTITNTELPMLDASKIAKLGNILNGIPDDGYSRITPIAIPKCRPVCSICDGKKTVAWRACEECKGVGSITFRNDYHEYDHFCKSCNADRFTYFPGKGNSCLACYGTGRGFVDISWKSVLGVPVSLKYICVLSRWNGIEFFPGKDCLYFRNGDHRGVLMGMRP